MHVLFIWTLFDVWKHFFLLWIIKGIVWKHWLDCAALIGKLGENRKKGSSGENKFKRFLFSRKCVYFCQWSQEINRSLSSISLDKRGMYFSFDLLPINRKNHFFFSTRACEKNWYVFSFFISYYSRVDNKNLKNRNNYYRQMFVAIAFVSYFSVYYLFKHFFFVYSVPLSFCFLLKRFLSFFFHILFFVIFFSHLHKLNHKRFYGEHDGRVGTSFNERIVKKNAFEIHIH